MIPYGRQDISESDIESVISVLRSDFLTQGPKVPEFEETICTYTGAKYGVAVNSATSALHIACLSLGLGQGDWLWTSPITFVATANCGLYCGAKVDFVDIDPQTYNLSPQALEEKLILAKKEGKLPKIVVPVHLAGLSCEMEEIHKLSKEYGFRIIEDASHAIGGQYQGEVIGSCKYSDITVFSFHPVKIITTAEGGMAITNDETLANKMTLLRSHGITRDKDIMTHEPDGPWYYQQIELGLNYRMTDIQAALGLSQLQRLDKFLLKRRKIAEKYDKALADLPISVQFQNKKCLSAYHLYIIRVKEDISKYSHKEVFNKLRHSGIGVNIHYIPIHTQPYYKKLGFNLGDFPIAEQYYREAISLPLFPNLKEIQQAYIVEVLKKALMI